MLLKMSDLVGKLWILRTFHDRRSRRHCIEFQILFTASCLVTVVTVRMALPSYSEFHWNSMEKDGLELE